MLVIFLYQGYNKIEEEYNVIRYSVKVVKVNE